LMSFLDATTGVIIGPPLKRSERAEGKFL
jgi:hypothetical protein